MLTIAFVFGSAAVVILIYGEQRHRRHIRQCCPNHNQCAPCAARTVRHQWHHLPEAQMMVRTTRPVLGKSEEMVVDVEFAEVRHEHDRARH